MKKKTLRIVVVVGSLILLFFVFMGGIFMGANGTVAGEIFGGFLKEQNFISAESSEIKIIDDIKRIKVEWVNGSVTVKPSEDENLYILEESGDSLSGSDVLVYKIDGNTLEIDFTKPTFGISGITSSLSKDLILQLPEKYYDKIMIDSVSSDVHIKNISAVKMDIESVSGEIEMQQTKFEYLDVESVSGNVDISLSDIASFRADIESVSGNVDIYLPATASFRAEIESVSGDFISDFEVIKQGDTYIRGNGDMEISVDIVSGDVSIYKK